MLLSVASLILLGVNLTLMYHSGVLCLFPSCYFNSKVKGGSLAQC